MLLRASGEHGGVEYAMDAAIGADAHASGVPDADLLAGFADAAVDGDAGEARERVLAALGPAALVDCAAVVAIFQAVVRVADATGIPLEPYKAELSSDLRGELGIDGYRAGG